MHFPRDENESRHPPAHRLEAVAAGDADARVADHLASCEACARYVDTLRAAAQAFRTQNDAAAFVARARASDGSRASLQSGRQAPRLARLTWAAGPILAAAAVILLLNAHRWSQTPATDRSLPHSEGSGDVPSIDLHFKGGVAAAVIRERDGQQERITGPVHVRAGDRIRVAISIDRGQPIAAGLLMDDGSWSPLMTPTWLDAGTHHSERAARFDESSTRATLVVGPPDAVERARKSRDFAGLLTWSVTSDP